jgi:hypothetical protein
MYPAVQRAEKSTKAVTTMPIAGVKPKTLTQKIKSGVRESRLNRNEPQPPDTKVTCPTWLEAPARAIYRKYEKLGYIAQVITVWDVDTFGIWCELMAMFQEEPRKMAGADMTQLRMLSELLGLAGPVSRARIVRVDKDKVNAEQQQATGPQALPAPETFLSR